MTPLRALKTSHRHVLVATAVAGAAVLAGSAAYGLRLFRLAFPYAGRSAIAFDAEEWREHRDDCDGTRFLMIDDLLAQDRLFGRSRTEVEALLGPPDHVSTEWTYCLGKDPSRVSIDDVTLDLRFDVDGTFGRVWKAKD